jgi:serine/threonine-protein kinase
MDDLRVVMERRAKESLAIPPAEALQGRRVGPYVLGKLLGEGGMARVYRAMDTARERPVAFKVLKPQYQMDHNLTARFEREARSMAGFEHENVVRILDVAQEEDLNAIVMELLTGGTVRQRIEEIRHSGSMIALVEAVTMIMQAARGIHVAHQQGIVHRDVKPSNLLLDDHGLVKVADFGTIHVLENTTWLTGVGQQIGTPGYMSPEQCAGERVTFASDVYSLGVTLYELMTGRFPFEVEEASPFALMLKHISEPPADPRQWREDIPAWLAKVVLKTLRKKPAERYGQAGELADALREGSHQLGDAHDARGTHADWRMDLGSIRGRLEQLPQRAIVYWACRCARRVQSHNPDPRVERALEMAEATVNEPQSTDTHASVTRALAKIRALRAASLRAAYAEVMTSESGAAAEAAKAAAAAAACAAARCIDDAAADAVFAARSALAALGEQSTRIQRFWEEARADFKQLRKLCEGQEGTVGKPIPKGYLEGLKNTESKEP